MNPEINIAQTAFSRSGSSLSIMIPHAAPLIGKGPPLGPGIYLRAHRCPMVERNVFRLDFVDATGRVREPSVTATPGILTLACGGGTVEICFAETDTLRIRGRNAGLRLRIQSQPGIAVHPSGDRRWVINARPSLCRFSFEPIAGKLQIDAPLKHEDGRIIVVDLSPDGNGGLEAAIDVFQSTWIPRRRQRFEECVSEVTQNFTHWLEKMPAAPEWLGEARALAAYVNWSSIIEPDGFITRPAMLMSKGCMDQVWSWDNCFNAMAACAGDPQLAWDQLWLMIDHQDGFGAFPDAVSPIFKHYNFSKPPVLGWALNAMIAMRPDFFSLQRLLEIYEPLGRWSRWWLAHRTAPGEALPHYLHGNDSGWDNSTMFDSGAPLIAPDLAALLVLQCDMLASIAQRLGKQGECSYWHAESARLLDALLGELWRGDHFIARRQHDRLEVHSESLIPLIPIVLGERLPEKVRAALLRSIPGFLTANGLATEKPSSPHYSGDGYWRGPIWAPPTMLIVDGLRQIGQTQLAAGIASRFCAMCARNGFAENFDAITGKGLRDTGYTWTASVFLLLAASLDNSSPEMIPPPIQ